MLARCGTLLVRGIAEHMKEQVTKTGFISYYSMGSKSRAFDDSEVWHQEQKTSLSFPKFYIDWISQPCGSKNPHIRGLGAPELSERPPSHPQSLP